MKTLLVVGLTLCSQAWAQSSSAGLSDLQPITERFIAAAGGSQVVDRNTGLTWRRCVEGMTWTGSRCEGEPSRFTFEGAKVHANSATDPEGARWRVPDQRELASIVDGSSGLPATDIDAFPQTPSAPTWSSSPFTRDSLGGKTKPNAAMYVHFANGLELYDDRSRTFVVRLVKAGRSSTQTEPAKR